MMPTSTMSLTLTAFCLPFADATVCSCVIDLSNREGRVGLSAHHPARFTSTAHPYCRHARRREDADLNHRAESSNTSSDVDSFHLLRRSSPRTALSGALLEECSETPDELLRHD